MRKYLILGAITASLIATGLLLSSAEADEHFSPYVDGKGNISFPNGFRSSMVHLGSWFVPEGGASGFHDVYTEKESVETYRKTGKFPDGATIVKELRASDSGTYTTGTNVSFATDGLNTANPVFLEDVLLLSGSEPDYTGHIVSLYATWTFGDIN